VELVTLSETPSILLTVEEAARLLHIGRSTVYELIAQGRIDSLKIGGSRRIERIAVDAYIASLRGTRGDEG
jgi:excisionase family DNA binding protein